MTMLARMAAAHAAIRTFKEERQKLLARNLHPDLRPVAERANAEMQDFLRDALDVYRSSLESIEIERRSAGPYHSKYARLEKEWSSSEELARELFEFQLDALRVNFAEIFKPPKKKCRKRRR